MKSTYRFTNIQTLARDGLRPSSIAVRRGRFASIDNPSELIDLEGAVVLPAFVNGHDHMELNGLPRVGRTASYRNATEWFEDVQRARGEPELNDWLATPLKTRLALSGFLNAFHGCLTVSHHNRYYRSTFRWGFPVDVIRRYGWCHSLAIEPSPRRAYDQSPAAVPFVLHFAEGFDDRARQELEELERLGMLGSRTILVHALGLTTDGMKRVAAAGGSIIWCPSSNMHLFGRTLDAVSAREAGVQLALGSDSTLSGEGGLLRELPLAREATGWTPQQLLDLVSEAPARMFGLSDRGSLEVGRRADFLVIDSAMASADFCPSRLRPPALVLVVRGGRPLLGAPSHRFVFERLGVPYQQVIVGCLERLLDRGYARHWARLSSEGLERLAGSVGGPA